MRAGTAPRTATKIDEDRHVLQRRHASMETFAVVPNGAALNRAAAEARPPSLAPGGSMGRSWVDGDPLSVL